ncbi:MAG: NifU family protein [Kiritimatiellae bacterium]|nr:NifU family protein [Kiritimatiellia bacterium]
MEEKIKEKVEDIRGMLQADGGDCEFVKLEGKTVYLRLHGACGSCPHAQMTLKNGVEAYLRNEVDPEIVVERVPDAEADE